MYGAGPGPHTHINITERGKAERIRWVDEIKRAIEIAEIIPFKYLIQHLGVEEQEFSEHAVEAAFYYVSGRLRKATLHNTKPDLWLIICLMST